MLREGAAEYAEQHLRELEVRANGWEVLYRCPVTGILWLLYYPDSAIHGGGTAVLSQLAA